MIRLSFFIIAILFLNTARTQQVVDLGENAPYEYNGLEYGFYISNEKNKEVKGEDFERYEVVLYVTNKSGCMKLIPFRSTSSSGSSSDEVKVAEFNCKNATGKRFTSKSGWVSARLWHAQVKVPNDVKGDKEPAYKFISAQAGHAIRNGETVSNKIIVIVPKGERPGINCRILYLPE
jgi:hypothetical protein